MESSNNSKYSSLAFAFKRKWWQ